MRRRIRLSKPLVLWVNDGLMAVFFFLVGLEIKREVLEGSCIARPGVAAGARGGRRHDRPGAHLCASSTGATPVDCAAGPFRRRPTSPSRSASCRCSGSRVPASLKVFLLALAILDDLGAIVDHRALLHGRSVAADRCSLARLALRPRRAEPAAGDAGSRPMCSRLRGLGLRPEVGHPRDARRRGHGDGDAARAQGRRLAARAAGEALHPYVTFAILPLFAFANAGVSLDGFSTAAHCSSRCRWHRCRAGGGQADRHVRRSPLHAFTGWRSAAGRGDAGIISSAWLPRRHRLHA